ncbi:hypothetical protein ACFFX0_24045 [Citricoccus parietis]|uniref:Uncharacterized protein n=1 Tax=Citricoccus parietis TaxID=592307 RepID=A0ABV5G596_9MICC
MCGTARKREEVGFHLSFRPSFTRSHGAGESQPGFSVARPHHSGTGISRPPVVFTPYLMPE